MAKLIHGYQGGGDEWLNLGRLILLYCLFLFSEQVSAGQMDITAQTRVIHWTSQYNATGWAAKNVIDGQVGVNHEWASTINPTYPQEIVFKLASQQPLRSVAINPKSSESPSRWAKDIALLQASSENGPWQLLGSMTLSQTDSYQTLNVRGDTGQFVKLRIDSSWGGNYVEIGDMKLYADPISTGLETPSGQGGDEITIVNTRNIATVQNGPRQFFTFTLTQPMVITRINTYHWNSGDGTPSPGKVGIKGHGSWQAQGKPGMYDTPNAEWWVYPNVTLPAGKYTVTDSDAATWSQNDQSGGIGHCVVYGRVVN